jgi:hypothetical protein
MEGYGNFDRMARMAQDRELACNWNIASQFGNMEGVSLLRAKS